MQNLCTYRNIVYNTQDTPPVVIHVNDNHSYFNVTRAMIFDSIEFRGENALAYMPTDATFPINTIPARLCQVTDTNEAAINGQYKPIVLTKNAN